MERTAGTTITPNYDVYFVGLQQNPFKYIRPATAFVFPSAWEGFPLALGEAMTCGIPVVSTDCPTGPREMLAPTTAAPTTPLRQAEWAEFGLLMPMLTEPASLAAAIACWADTLDQLLADAPTRRTAGAGRPPPRQRLHAPAYFWPSGKTLIDGLLPPARIR